MVLLSVNIAVSLNDQGHCICVLISMIGMTVCCRIYFGLFNVSMRRLLPISTGQWSIVEGRWSLITASQWSLARIQHTSSQLLMGLR